MSEGTASRVRIANRWNLVHGFMAVRLAVVGCGMLYLLLAPGLSPRSLGDWLLALAALGLVLVSGWFLPGQMPAVVAAGQALLLGVAEIRGSDITVVPKVALAVALVDVCLHVVNRRVVTGVVVTAVAGYLVAVVAGHVPPGSLLFRIVVGVGGPILVAAYLLSIERERAAARRLADDLEREQTMREHMAREAERSAFARELHDVVAHHMTSILVRVGVARQVCDGVDREVGAVLDDVHVSAETALADTRRLLRGLRQSGAAPIAAAVIVEPGELSTVILSAVERARLAGWSVESELNLGTVALDAGSRLAVVRVVQEGLTNAMRHGAVGCLKVAVAQVRDGRAVQVMVSNPMRATDIGEAGYGIAGIRERVEILGGRVDIGPNRGDWVLTVQIPVGAERTAE